MFLWAYRAGQGVFRATNRLLGLARVQLVPIHFYEPIPDLRALERRGHWGPGSQRAIGAGIDFQDEAALAFLRSAVARHARDPPFQEGGAGGFTLSNPAFGRVDAEVYYAMLREKAPRHVVEVGGGNSSLLAAAALKANREDADAGKGRGREGRGGKPGQPAGEPGPARLTVVEPFPSPALSALAQAGGCELVAKPVQDVDLTLFGRLGAGDVLFIDSSHVSKAGSDLNWLLFQVLPRLPPGVLVHFHDVFLPGDYPREWVHGMKRFWNENYLVALLARSPRFRVLWGGAHMHATHPDALARHVPSYDPATVQPTSFWLATQ